MKIYEPTIPNFIYNPFSKTAYINIYTQYTSTYSNAPVYQYTIQYTNTQSRIPIHQYTTNVLCTTVFQNYVYQYIYLIYQYTIQETSIQIHKSSIPVHNPIHQYTTDTPLAKLPKSPHGLGRLTFYVNP